MTPDKQVGLPFFTKNGAGMLTNADTTPTVVVLRNAVQTTVAVTVQLVATGQYSAIFTPPADWRGGDLVDINITATIGGYTDTHLVRAGVIDIPIDTSALATSAAVAAVAATVNTVAADVADLQGLV